MFYPSYDCDIVPRTLLSFKCQTPYCDYNAVMREYVT